MKRVLLFLSFLVVLFPSVAQGEQENTEVSVLTCSPGDEVYSLYGHTAIRVRNGNADLVFNYGVFDFNTDYFIWKFVLGQTDYMCAAVPWKYFVREYEERGSSVTAQVLNLTEVEAEAIRMRLMDNIRPQNRVYRYNYLTNNCTTKVMDLVEECVDGSLVYSWHEEPVTYRQLLHRYTELHPWAREGNDLLLGAEVDTLLSHRATCFLPEYYMDALSAAVVRNDFQDTRKLVSRTDTLVGARKISERTSQEFPFTPMQLGWGVFAIGFLVMCLELWTHRMFWPLDILLMLAHGLAGCLILFVFLFSEHPTLDSNWLVGILNPIPLILLPSVTKAAWYHRTSLWHHFMAVWMALYLLFMPWMPQQMCVLALPLTATLLTRQISYILNSSATTDTFSKSVDNGNAKKENKSKNKKNR